MNPHVYILTPQYPDQAGVSVGGLFTHAAELHGGLIRLGCPVTVVTPRLNGPSEVQDGIHRVRPSDRVMSIPFGSDGEPTAQHLTLYSEELVRYVVEYVTRTGERPSIIHVHDYYLVPAALEMRKLLHVPVVLSVHILHAPLRTWWGSPLVPAVAGLERMACREVDALITVSDSMKSVLEESLGIQREKITVVHNGFDPAPFARAPTPEEARRARERLGVTNERIVVYAGRLTRQKGVVQLLRSAVQVIEQLPDVVYALAGTPVSREGQTDERIELLDELDALFAQHPALARRVRTLGNLSREELAHVYGVASLAVIPSVYEPFGYAAVEAMAAGVPVVANAVGGLPEIIEDGQTGLLVPVDRPPAARHTVDEAALARAQLRLLRDGELASRLVRNGREQVLARFTHERMARETIDVYRRLAS